MVKPQNCESSTEKKKRCVSGSYHTYIVFLLSTAAEDKRQKGMDKTFPQKFSFSLKIWILRFSRGYYSMLLSAFRFRSWRWTACHVEPRGVWWGPNLRPFISAHCCALNIPCKYWEVQCSPPTPKMSHFSSAQPDTLFWNENWLHGHLGCTCGTTFMGNII